MMSPKATKAWLSHSRRKQVLLVLSVSCNAAAFCYYILYPSTCSASMPRHGAEAVDEQASAGAWSRSRHLHTTNSSSSHGSHNASSQSSHGSHGHHSHQHDVLLFLFNAIFVGTAVLHVAAVFPRVQLSVTLFVLGMVVSFILKGANVKDELDIFGESYGMWMNIDPHLLLFTMLPTLLAGDAMTIDTSVAKRVGQQCLFLAGPGVLAAAMITAQFLSVFLDWSFLLSLVTGSILCATDPVAVVALLKELGASPTLTVQIQGESLLNDGTAIVLYTVAYDMLSGKKYDVADMMMFMVQTAIMAVGLGIFLGYVFFSWIRAASNRFNHSSPVIQILLTICAAYWSFVLAEGVLKMSGVLATVACSLVLAHHMWPHIVDHDAMLDFWHTIENLGNIVIFILGGALIGTAMLKINAVDYLNLLVIYLFLILLRGSLIFCSRPILRFLHKDGVAVSAADATVMTWGGLRGAVGLALAIQVNRGRATNSDGEQKIDEETADRVLFFVAGVALLTTCINATTCPFLVDWLNITALPEAEAKLLHKFNERLISFSMGQNNPHEVTDRLETLLDHIADGILNTRTRVNGPDAGREVKMQSNADIIAAYREAVEEFELIPQEELHRLNHVPGTLDGRVEKMLKLLGRPKSPDPELTKALNKVFLNMVNTNYWTQIEHGELRPGSDEADLLFTSIRFSTLKPDLEDFKFLHHLQRRRTDRISDARISTSKALVIDTHKSLKEQRKDLPGRIMHNARFSLGVSLAILVNVVFVCIEEITRNDNNDDMPLWIAVEALFTMIFLFEFVVKAAHLRLEYFMSSWNNFDFFLVLAGVAGLILSILAQTKGGGAASAGSNGSRVIRISRVLRTMRFLRLFRLFHARLSADKYVSEELSQAIKQLATWNSFVQAHCAAQSAVINYFGGKLDESGDIELARCVIQSLISVHRALVDTIEVHGKMDAAMVDELRNVRERKHIIEELENFVEAALKDGAISSKNAGRLLHPLHHELSECIEHLNKRRDGVTTLAARLKLQQKAQLIAKLNALHKANDPTTKAEGDSGAGVEKATTFAEKRSDNTKMKNTPSADDGDAAAGGSFSKDRDQRIGEALVKTESARKDPMQRLDSGPVSEPTLMSSSSGYGRERNLDTVPLLTTSDPNLLSPQESPVERSANWENIQSYPTTYPPELNSTEKPKTRFKKRKVPKKESPPCFQTNSERSPEQ